MKRLAAAALTIIATAGLITATPTPTAAQSGACYTYGWGWAEGTVGRDNGCAYYDVQARIKRYINGRAYYRYSGWKLTRAEVNWSDGRSASNANHIRGRYRDPNTGQVILVQSWKAV